MSCQACQDQQKMTISAYYRWKDANIEMRGCNQHLREIFKVLNEIQAQVPKQESLP